MTNHSSQKKPTKTELVTLADVDARIRDAPQIAEQTRRHLRSAISRTSSLLGRPSADIPCDPRSLRPALKALHPQRARRTKKSISNIKSDLARALRCAGVLGELSEVELPSPQWQTFLDRAAVDHQRWQLARFARFCTAYGIEPDGVTDAHLDRFRDELSFSQLTGDPDEIHKDTARNFNRVLCDGQINRPPLEVPRKQGYLAAPLTTYPESLQADIDAYLARLANPGHFDDTGH